MRVVLLGLVLLVVLGLAALVAPFLWQVLGFLAAVTMVVLVGSWLVSAGCSVVLKLLGPPP